MLTITCRSCQKPIEGSDEDDLVRRAQEHADGHARAGERAHAVSRRHVLARLARESSGGDDEPARGGH